MHATFVPLSVTQTFFNAAFAFCAIDKTTINIVTDATQMFIFLAMFILTLFVGCFADATSAST